MSLQLQKLNSHHTPRINHFDLILRESDLVTEKKTWTKIHRLCCSLALINILLRTNKIKNEQIKINIAQC